jgi:hypothetical protein
MSRIMKRLFLLSSMLGLVFTSNAVLSEDYNNTDWQNPLLVGINKLPPRNTAWPCPDAESAWKSNVRVRASPSFRQVLQYVELDA